MRVFLCLLAALAMLSACATKQPYADDETIARVRYTDPGPPELVLYTMINNRTGGGAHSSLMISASERVIFDPAGSFYASVVPERNDVLFGISPAIEQAYRGAHARSTHHVVIQSVEVTQQQAETAYRLALSNGAVAGAFCSNATAQLLQKVPGFEQVRGGFSPKRLMRQFGSLPGVRTEEYHEDDSPDLQKALAEGDRRLAQDAALAE
ncbi:hypothetical protein [Pukyongiella litopenaei]|nr:hypothetical protein [Pukyongiella litopenaei]